MSRHVIELVRCDFCGASASEDNNVDITTLSYGWMGRAWEIDVCPTHKEEVESNFEDLTANSRRTEMLAGPPRRSPSRPIDKNRYPRQRGTFGIYLNKSTGNYECPWVDENGKKCPREFGEANGLGVHHARTHGVKLTGQVDAPKENPEETTASVSTKEPAPELVGASA